VHGIMHGQTMRDCSQGVYETVDPEYDRLRSGYMNDLMRGEALLDPLERSPEMTDFSIR
jgi:hypothetical protein